MVLLVIDRSHSFLQAVSRCAAMLEGCRVSIACGTEAGMRAALTIRPDVILTDHTLRSADGVPLLRRLRPLLPEATLVCLVLGAEEKHFDALWQASADLCVRKPQLPASLGAILEYSSRLRLARSRLQ